MTQRRTCDIMGVTTQPKTGGTPMSHYTHFTTEERELSREMRAQGFRRNTATDGHYSACHADKMYHERRKNCRRKLKLNQHKLRQYVIEKLLEYWSPEQIAGRAKLEKKYQISYTTIYRAIKCGLLPKQLKKQLRICSHYRTHKKDDKRGKIADTAPITERPAGAINRTRQGH